MPDQIPTVEPHPPKSCAMPTSNRLSLLQNWEASSGWILGAQCCSSGGPSPRELGRKKRMPSWRSKTLWKVTKLLPGCLVTVDSWGASDAGCSQHRRPSGAISGHGKGHAHGPREICVHVCMLA